MVESTDCQQGENTLKQLRFFHRMLGITYMNRHNEVIGQWNKDEEGNILWTHDEKKSNGTLVANAMQHGTIWWWWWTMNTINKVCKGLKFAPLLNSPDT